MPFISIVDTLLPPSESHAFLLWLPGLSLSHLRPGSMDAPGREDGRARSCGARGSGPGVFRQEGAWPVGDRTRCRLRTTGVCTCLVQTQLPRQVQSALGLCAGEDTGSIHRRRAVCRSVSSVPSRAWLLGVRDRLLNTELGTGRTALKGPRAA